MRLFFICVFSSLSVNILETLFITSPSTPKILLDEFSDTLFSVKIFWPNLSLVHEMLSIHDISLLVDLTLDNEYMSLIDQASENHQLAYITTSQSNSITNFPNRFYIHDKSEKTSEFITSVVEFLDFKELCILYSSNYRDVNLAIILESKLTRKIISSISFKENLDIENAEYLIRRIIKAKGIRKMLIIDSSNSLENIQKALQKSNLIKAGIYFLIVTNSPRKIFLDGALVFVEAGGEKSESWEENEKILIENAIGNIATGIIKKSILFDKNDVFRFLEEEYPNKYLSNGFKLLNIQHGKIVEVGIYTDFLNMTTKMIFPGNIDFVIPENALTSITLSIANGTSELIDNMTNPTFAFWYKGAEYAVFKSNQNKDFNNFYLELFLLIVVTYILILIYQLVAFLQ